MRFAVPFIVIAALLATAQQARAGHLFCHHCRCHTNCKKICRLECGKKKETKIEYECETEDFCVPGPSHKRGYTYECGPHGHKHRKPIWQPTCAKVHTRKKLIKKEVTKEVPDFKWVVEEYCCICGVLVKIEREPADGKAAGGGRAPSPTSAPAKSGSKAETPLEQLPLAEIEGRIPPSAGEAADQYAAYYEGFAGAALDDDAESAGEPPADDDGGGEHPPAREPRLLFGRWFGK